MPRLPKPRTDATEESGIGPKKITKQLVMKLAPSVDGKIMRIADTELKGFYLDVLPTGTRVFRIRYRLGSQRKWFTIGEFPAITTEQAREEAKRRLGMATLDQDPEAERKRLKEAVTVKQLSAKFIELHVEPSLSETTIKGYKEQINHCILPELGKRLVLDINQEEIQLWHLRQSKNSRASADYALRVLACMFSKAEAWGYLPKNTNPARGVKKNPQIVKHRPLNLDEFSKVGAFLNAAIENRTMDSRSIRAIQLLMLTGCRRSEIVFLKWSDVHLDEGYISLSKHKTQRHGKSRIIALSPEAVEILRALPRGKSEWVFPSSVKPEKSIQPITINLAWDTIRKAVGIADARLHDLRHSVGASAGAQLPQYVVMALLGHSQPSTTARYATPVDEVIRNAANTVQGQIAQALGLKSKIG